MFGHGSSHCGLFYPLPHITAQLATHSHPAYALSQPTHISFTTHVHAIHSPLTPTCTPLSHPTEKGFLKDLESALRFGTPLLVQDVESIDPILNPILNRELRRTGGRVLIALGDQDIDFSPSFRIIMTTRDPSVSSGLWVVVCGVWGGMCGV